MFDRLTVEMGWPAGPVVPVNPSEPHVNETAFPVDPSLIAGAGRGGDYGYFHIACRICGRICKMWLTVAEAWSLLLSHSPNCSPHGTRAKEGSAQRRCNRIRRQVRRASTLFLHNP